MSNNQKDTLLRVILVLGSHRSGTSATTRLLNLLGAQIPGPVMDAIPGNNERGFWEPKELVDLNDAILHAAGSSWDDIRPLPGDWQTRPEVLGIREEISSSLAEVLPQSGLVVIKDPRLSRLLPLWHELLLKLTDEVLHVFVLRNPLEVAASLRQRDGFAIPYSLLLSLRYELEAERSSRNWRRSFVAFEDLLEDWPGEMGRISDELGLAFPVDSPEIAEVANEFLTPSLRHHRFSLDELDRRQDLPPLRVHTHHLLRELIPTHDSVRGEDEIRKELDRIKADLDQADSLFGPISKQAGERPEIRVSLSAPGVTGSPTARTGRRESALEIREELEEVRSEIRRLKGNQSELIEEPQGLTESLGPPIPAEVPNRASSSAPREDCSRLFANDSRSQGELALEHNRNALAHAEREIRFLRNRLQVHEGEVKEENHPTKTDLALHRAKYRWEAMRGSRSWRFTAPVRVAARWLNRLRKGRWDLQRIVDHPLFDDAFYRSRVPGLESRRDAALHFLELGAAAAIDPHPLFSVEYYLGHFSEPPAKNPLLHYSDQPPESYRSPNRLFDPDYYLRQITDEAKDVVDPLIHYSRQKGLAPDPHPLFDTAYYFERNPDADRESNALTDHRRLRSHGRQPDVHPLFDQDYYRRTNPDIDFAETCPLFHFLGSGGDPEALRDPHPLFDSTFYRSFCPSAQGTDELPLLHYLRKFREQAELAKTHPLFDGAFYWKENPDVASAGAEPLRHFLAFGHRREHPRRPHPFFDTEFYLRENPDVAKAGINPLVHYLDFGHRSLHPRDPHPLFATAYYLRRNPDVEQSSVPPLVHFVLEGWRRDDQRAFHPLFDMEHYFAVYGEQMGPHQNPLEHYLEAFEGGMEPPSPHPLFDSAYYLRRNPDCRGLDPASHYVLHGLESNRPRECNPLFDAAYYADRYSDRPSARDLPPLLHFLLHGAQDHSLDPHPLFQTEYFVEQVGDSGEKLTTEHGIPYLLYLKEITSGRELPDPHPLFDSEFYLLRSPDVQEAGISPFEHFARHGVFENRDPHPLFDTAYYSRQIHDGAEPDGVPLWIYLTEGDTRDADPHPLFSQSFYRVEMLGSARIGDLPLLEHYLVRGATEKLDPNPYFDTPFYESQLDPELTESPRFNPLRHFVECGAAEGIPPHPSCDGTALAELVRTGNSLDLDLLARCSTYVDSMDDDGDYRQTKKTLRKLKSRRDRARNPKSRSPILFDPADVKPEWQRLRFPRCDEPTLTILVAAAPEGDVPDELPGREENSLELLQTLHSLQVLDGIEDAKTIVLFDEPHPDLQQQIERIEGSIATWTKRDPDSPWPWAHPDAADGELVFLLEAGIQPNPTTFRRLRSALDEDPELGAAGARILAPSGHLLEAGCAVHRDGKISPLGHGDDPQKRRYRGVREVDACSGRCLLVRSGSFAEEAEPTTDGIELCLELRRRGLGVVSVGDAEALSTRDSPEAPTEYEATRPQVTADFDDLVERLDDVRLVALYLPQFHPIPENDEWWGKGFTEWTNVTRARPCFQGHDQPTLPTELGFYDLRAPGVMNEQADLAREHGVDAFCFYAYWFGGRRLLETPLEHLLGPSPPDIDFCLAWANESWSRRWDGLDHDVLIAQEHDVAVDAEAIRDFIPFFRSQRYLSIDGKPLFLIYRVGLMPDPHRVFDHWREICLAEGIGEIHLAGFESFELAGASVPPENFGLDSMVEFPPHNMPALTSLPEEKMLGDFSGDLHDYRRVVRNAILRQPAHYSQFRGVFPRWDNTPRRCDQSTIFLNSSPGTYRAWLEEAIDDVRRQNFGEERLVFINAWNEWAEGAYLEPDETFGRRYLEATRDAVSSLRKPKAAEDTKETTEVLDEVDDG